MKFKWTDSTETALCALIDQLTCAPILAYPDFGREFFLETDASGTGLSGILYQNFDDGPHPIAYYSQCLSSYEQWYSATELKCLAGGGGSRLAAPLLKGVTRIHLVLETTRHHKS